MTRPTPEHRLPTSTSAALLALTLVVAAVTFIQGFRGLSPLPLFDEWGFLDPAYVSRTLWTVHNSHRIVIPRLIFLADLRFFGGRNVADFAFTCAALLGICVTYLLASRLTFAPSNRTQASAPAISPVPLSHSTAVFGTVLGFVVNPFTVGFLLWGMHVQNVGVLFFAALAFLLLSRAADPGASRAARGTLAAAASAAAACATFTSANGLLVPCLLAPQALLLRLRKRIAALLALGAAICSFFFLHGNSAQGSVTSTVISTPWAFTKFVFLFQGATLTQLVSLRDTITHQGLAFATGAASVCLLAVNAFAYLRRRIRTGDTDPFAVFTLTAGAFLFASGVLVAAGRTPFGLPHAYVEHYNILRFLYWANLLVAIPACHRTLRSWYAAAAAALVTAAAFACAIPERAQGLAYRAASLNTAAAAIAAGVYDPAVWHRVNNWDEGNAEATQFMQRQARSLAARNLSVFSVPPASWMGHEVSSIGVSPAAGAVRGRITASTPAADAFGTFQIVAGRVDGGDVDTDRFPQVVLADASGRVVGFAAVAADRSPDTAWTGYARSDRPPATAYLYTGGRLRPITAP